MWLLRLARLRCVKTSIQPQNSCQGRSCDFALQTCAPVAVTALLNTQRCALVSAAHCISLQHTVLEQGSPCQSHASHYLSSSLLVILSLGASDLNSHVNGLTPSGQASH